MFNFLLGSILKESEIIMLLEEKISELKRISYQKYEDMEIETFNELISDIWNEAGISQIGDLCLLLDDENEFPSVLHGVMDLIFQISERSGIDRGMFEIARNVPKMLIRGREWAQMFHKMMLNSYDDMTSYINAIKKVDSKTKQMIIDILNEVKQSQPDKYSEKVDGILKAVLS